MSYNKTSWISGDIISAEKMNKLENGLESVSNNCDELSTKTTSLENKLNDILDDTLTDPNKAAQAKKVGDKIDELKEDLADKIGKNQGTENVGKIPVVGTDGCLTLIDMPEPGVAGDVVGTLDESNNLLLSGNIADGTYTLQYFNNDGTYVGSGNLVVGQIETTGGNLADPTSDDWVEGYRLSTGTGAPKALEGHIVTNFIPVKMGDTLRIKGLNMFGCVNSYYAAVAIYKNDKTYQNFVNTGISSTASGDGAKELVAVDGDVYTYTILMQNGGQRATEETAYIRVDSMLLDGYTAQDVIITVNEEIA